MEKLKPEAWSRIVRSGGRVFLGSAAGCPRALLDHFLANTRSAADIELVCPLPLGPLPWLGPPRAAQVRANVFFLNEALSRALRDDEVDYTPCQLSAIPELLRNQELPLDVALIQVAPPDASGRCSLGVSVDVTAAAHETARFTVAQINPLMPRTRGHAHIDLSEIDYLLECEEPLLEVPPPAVDEVNARIAGHVSQLIRDGDTIQVGADALPQAVLRSLDGCRHLGIHTDVITDAVMEAIRRGLVDNSRKLLHPDVTVGTFAVGTRALYDFIDDNPAIELHPSDTATDPATIARNPRMVAINGAVEVDLTGQVASDSVGEHFFHGIGSQQDFIRGASMSPQGCPIIALPSTARNGEVSRILDSFQPGTGVVVTRADVHYVVTEYGVATLHGRNIRERTLEMIEVAHPKFRDQLLASARERGWVPRYHQAAATVAAGTGSLDSKNMTFGGRPFTLRPLHPSDVRHLQEFFYSHDSESIRRRYGHDVRHLPAEQAYRLVNVDQSRDLALALFDRRGAREIIVAVGRFYLDENEESAEIFLIVDQAHREKGMATFLLEALVAAARERGIKRLRSEVDNDNAPMLAVLKSHPRATLTELTIGKTRAELVLEEPPGEREVL